MKSRSRGMLLGLAIGDALGAPVEFLPDPGSLYIEEMGDKIAHFHDNYRNPKGVWTDDTEICTKTTTDLINRAVKHAESYQQTLVRERQNLAKLIK